MGFSNPDPDKERLRWVEKNAGVYDQPEEEYERFDTMRELEEYLDED